LTKESVLTLSLVNRDNFTAGRIESMISSQRTVYLQLRTKHPQKQPMYILRIAEASRQLSSHFFACAINPDIQLHVCAALLFARKR
jgi:hypothetical protein